MEQFDVAVDEFRNAVNQSDNAQNYYLNAVFYLGVLIAAARSGVGPVAAPPVPNTFNCPRCQDQIHYY